MKRGDQLLHMLHLFGHNKCSEWFCFILPERWGVRRRGRDGRGEAKVREKGYVDYRDMQHRTDQTRLVVFINWQNSDKEAKQIGTTESMCWGNYEKIRLVGHKEGSCIHAKAHMGCPPGGVYSCLPFWPSVLKMRPNLHGFSSLWSSSYIHNGKTKGWEFV